MFRNIRIELSRKELESNTHNRIKKDIIKGVADEVTPLFFYTVLLIYFIVFNSYWFSMIWCAWGIKN